jgi:2-hydroxy-3-keto-5-methylthiopentenyl-1-phosphate phosphatase
MMAALKIFCDFDGTVCRSDVRSLLFRTFGNETAREADELWLKGEISSQECIRRECASVKNIVKKEWDALIDRQEVDPSFLPFIRFCRERNIEIDILSDGFDYYIRRILERHDLDFIPVFANGLHIEDTILQPSFPHLNPNCERSANCKGTHVLTRAADGQLRVFIGDGYSDRCAADYADIVFAKRRLIGYCRDENISYFEYNDFRDVQERVEQLCSKKRLTVRHRAEIRRREAFRLEANV